MKAEDILKQLKSLSKPKDLEGMARFGIDTKNAYGISIYTLRKIAKNIGKNHQLAQKLWASKIHEARILASMIDEPARVTEKQMEKWVKDFNSWDICDQVISNLFDQTKYAYKKAFAWSKQKEEFVKRAGFVMMASLSVHDKKAKNKDFEQFFPVIKREITDERNFVKKAVNWALRQIGKRNLALNKQAIALAKEIKKTDNRTARWIANDALRELTSKKVKNRLAKP